MDKSRDGAGFGRRHSESLQKKADILEVGQLSASRRGLYTLESAHLRG